MKGRLPVFVVARTRTTELFFFVQLLISLLFFGSCVAFAQDVAASANSEKQEIKYSISYGFKFNDRKYGQSDGLSEQKGSFAFKLVPHPKFSVKISNDNFVRGRETNGTRGTAFGNTSLTMDYTFHDESTKSVKRDNKPTLAAEYAVYFPTGSRTRGVNVGRVDHEVLGIFAKKLKKVAVDAETIDSRDTIEADMGAYFSGDEGLRSYSTTAEGYFSISHVLDNLKNQKYTYKFEVDFENVAPNLKTQIKAVNGVAVTLSPSSTLVFNLSTGLSANTPRVGFNVVIIYGGRFHIGK
jgi:hypothetical protein